MIPSLPVYYRAYISTKRTQQQPIMQFVVRVLILSWEKVRAVHQHIPAEGAPVHNEARVSKQIPLIVSP
jgi:hypothetical protein